MPLIVLFTDMFHITILMRRHIRTIEDIILITLGCLGFIALSVRGVVQKKVKYTNCQVEHGGKCVNAFHVVLGQISILSWLELKLD